MPKKHPKWKNCPEIARGRTQPEVQDQIVYLLDQGWSLDEVSQASGVCVRQLRFVLSGQKRVRQGTAMLLNQTFERVRSEVSVLDFLDVG